MPQKPIRVTYAVSGVDISQARKRDRRRRQAPVFRLPAASPPPTHARPASSATGRKASSAPTKPVRICVFLCVHMLCVMHEGAMSYVCVMLCVMLCVTHAWHEGAMCYA